jgi:tetratricopeptide (TPR) repeat protein
VATRFVYGTVLYAVGDYPRAKSELARVTEQKPRIADAHFALALTNRELGYHAEADAQFRAYLELAPEGLHAAEAQGSLLSTMPAPKMAEPEPVPEASEAKLTEPKASEPKAKPKAKP